MKKVIISFILGIVLSGTVVYAYVFYAQDISYDNTNSNISANNVQDAIDKLYEIASSDKYLGSISFSSYSQNSNLNISNYENYMMLTENDFIVIPTAYANGCYYISSTNGTCNQYTYKPSVTSYDANTGILSVNSGNIGHACTNWGCDIMYASTVDIYIK